MNREERKKKKPTTTLLIVIENAEWIIINGDEQENKVKNLSIQIKSCTTVICVNTSIIYHMN